MAGITLNQPASPSFTSFDRIQAVWICIHWPLSSYAKPRIFLTPYYAWPQSRICVTSRNLVLARSSHFRGHKYGSTSAHALNTIPNLHKKAQLSDSHTHHSLPSTVPSVSRMKFFLYISTLLTYAIATPISPDETSKTFKLRSLVLSPSNSSFNNLYLKAYHIYPSHNYAVLAPKTPENLGNVGYLNGTAEDFANKNTDLLFDFSPGTYSFIIDSVNATYNPIFINIGNGTGTAGIFIDQNMIKYHSPISGGFYGKWTLPANEQRRMFADNPSLQQHAAGWTRGAAFSQAEGHQHAWALLGCRAGGWVRGIGDPNERLWAII